MMRLSVLLVGVVILVIACCAQSFGAVSFVREKTFTVPGVANPVSTITFSALWPGQPLVALVSDSAHAALYSVQDDSILFETPVDSGFTFAAATLADANRDSVLDLAVVSYMSQIPGIYPDSLLWRITVYEGASNLSSKTTDSLFAGGNMDCLLRGVTLDSTPWPYLLFSYSIVTLEWQFNMWFQEDDYGGTRFYEQFPASASNFVGKITGIDRLPLGAGNFATLASLSSSYYHEISGPDFASSADELAILNLHSLSGLALTSPIYGTGGDCAVNSNWNSNSFACSGNIGYGDSVSLISEFTHRFVCGGLTPDDPGTTIRYLNCWQMNGTTPNSLRWSLDISGKGYGHFAYHPLLPGHFFAFSGDTLIMFRGSDGSIRDRITTSVPSGDRHWDYLDSDSIPRLVVVNHDTVSIYHLDIATDIADEDRPATVPSQFRLEDPYPNPFNPATTLSIWTGKGGQLTLEIFNVKGQRVALLFDGNAEPDKYLQFVWDAAGRASGVYFARLQLAGEKQVKKMLLLK